RRWEPKRLRLQLFSIAAKLTRHARRTRLKLAATAPNLQLLLDGIARLATLPNPG
ncbi:transposase, partial [Gordonia sp. DT30]